MHAPVLRDVTSIRRFLEAKNLRLPGRDDTRPTGFLEIDRLLEGGIPKNAITVLTGSSGAGRMSLVARMLSLETKAKRPVAWIDGRSTVYPPALQQAGVDLSRMLMVRDVKDRGLYAVEQILESGAFGIVVASGLESNLSPAGLRRVQTATEKNGASTVFLLEPHASAAVTHAMVKLKVVQRVSGTQVEVEKARGEMVGRRAFIEMRQQHSLR
jgi:hypothetical protein